MPVNKTIDAGVALLSMDLGRGNAIDDAFIGAMHRALDEIEVPEVRAVVLTGQGRMFSGGLNLLAVGEMDREGVARFVDAFDGMFERLFAFAKPVVAAINGHALAGGCILSLACDHRIMARGDFAIGANEVMLGIPFPAAAFEICRHALPPTVWGEALLEGRRFSPEEAARKGVVHAVAGDAGVVAEAMDQARRFAAGGADALSDIKEDGVGPALARIAATRAARKARFLERWFAAEAQGRIRKVREELLRRRGG